MSSPINLSGNSILNLCPSVMTEEQLKRKAKCQAQRCTDPVERFKYVCLSNGLTTIKNILRFLDKGRLTLEEFILITNKCGLHVSNEDAKAVFGKIANKESCVAFDDFSNALKPSVNATRTALIERVFKLVSSGKEYATLEDLKAAYNYKKQAQYLSGEKTKEEVAEMFLKSFDAEIHEDGIVTKQDFLNYYAAVSAAVEGDIYFDLMMRNTWNIS